METHTCVAVDVAGTVDDCLADICDWIMTSCTVVVTLWAENGMVVDTDDAEWGRESPC